MSTKTPTTEGAKSTAAPAPAAPDVTVTAIGAVATDPAGRVTVAAEHPRTVAERVGTLTDKERKELEKLASPGRVSVAEGDEIKVSFPDTPPPEAERLRADQIEALSALGEGDEYDLGDTRAFPTSIGQYVNARRVKLVSKTKGGEFTFEVLA